MSDKVKDNFFLISLCISICSLPLSLRVNSLSFILLALAWLIRTPIKEIVKNTKQPLLWLFVGFFLLHVFGLLWTENIKHGFWELEKKVTLLVLPLIIGTSKPLDKSQFKTVLKVFVIAIISFAIVCLLRATYRVMTNGAFFEVEPGTNYVIYYFFYDGLVDFLVQPMYCAAYVALAIFILIFSMKSWGEWTTFNKLITILAVVFLAVFLFMLSARTLILAFVVMSMINIVWWSLKNQKVIVGFVALSGTVIVITLLIAFVPVLRERVTEVFNSTFTFRNDPATNADLAGKLDDTNMRLAKWYFTIEAGKDTWFAGQGTGDDEDALMNAYMVNNFREGYVPRYNSHNQYLQTWLGLGVIGLLFFLASLAIPAIGALRSDQRLYFTFLGLIALFACTESMLCRQSGVVFYAFFNALFAFHYPKDEEPDIIGR